MNLFNCFQAVAFYTAVPFGIQWLATNGYNALAFGGGVVELIGFCMLSYAISEFKGW